MNEYYSWQNPAANPGLVKRVQVLLNILFQADCGLFDVFFPHYSKFSFCQYPFILSLAAKRFIMQKDSESQMIVMARVRIQLCLDVRGEEQGWHSGESARLPPMCRRFDSHNQRHKWAEFVGSLLCSERFFSGYSGFRLSPKTNIWFNLEFIWFTVSPISRALMFS